jgi:hypothetical protein
MAAGVPFLGFTPPRPLRIFYLQAEITICASACSRSACRPS